MASSTLAAPGPTSEQRVNADLRLHPPLEATSRVVFMGDSITDGFSYPLMVQQSLREAGKPVPTIIDGGVASDTAKDMLARLDRDVLSYHPTLVTFSAGANDALRGVTSETYEAEVSEIAEKLHAAGIPMVFLTTSVYGPTHLDAEATSAKFNDVLHRIAQKYGDPVAEVNAGMQTARAAGVNLIEDDNVHPNYEGHRVMARAVLDALGYTAVPLPTALKPPLLPGIIPSWQLRIAPGKMVVDENNVTTLLPNAMWKTLQLPEAQPQPHWWKDQERQRGFAMGVEGLLGPAKMYQGFAILDAVAPKQVYFNTGAGLQSVWLNGKQIYKNTTWTGWHAGKERIPAILPAGRNTIVIETNGAFFLSVTDNNTW